jgi:pSer/pThr/pTyr-binding forkhead associated (FHA) protein
VGFPPHSLSPSELAAVLAAERESVVFLAYRDGTGDLRLTSLGNGGRLTIGRTDENDIVLDWDPQVSRAHAQLELVGGGWTLVDDGLSRNGSFVNTERVLGRRRLEDGDMLRFGSTSVLFRSPAPTVESTAAATVATLARVSDAERRVLVALCRPLLVPGSVAPPASNREIADSLHLSLDGVKTHIRALFAKLEIEDLPQNRKRAELARRALQSGLVTARDARE